jgi:hypothetical protein
MESHSAHEYDVQYFITTLHPPEVLYRVLRVVDLYPRFDCHCSQPSSNLKSKSLNTGATPCTTHTRATVPPAFYPEAQHDFFHATELQRNYGCTRSPLNPALLYEVPQVALRRLMPFHQAIRSLSSHFFLSSRGANSSYGQSRTASLCCWLMRALNERRFLASRRARIGSWKLLIFLACLKAVFHDLTDPIHQYDRSRRGRLSILLRTVCPMLKHACLFALRFLRCTRLHDHTVCDLEDSVLYSTKSPLIWSSVPPALLLYPEGVCYLTQLICHPAYVQIQRLSHG